MTAVASPSSRPLLSDRPRSRRRLVLSRRHVSFIVVLAIASSCGKNGSLTPPTAPTGQPSPHVSVPELQTHRYRHLPDRRIDRHLHSNPGQRCHICRDGGNERHVHIHQRARRTL